MGFILAGLLVYISCRKIDRQPDESTTSSTESKFFSSHPSSDPLVQAINQFVKKENNKYHFVDKLVKQIGYPYWGKSIVISGNKHIGGRGASDSTNTIFIPFALDSQNVVNASLVINTSPTDTTFHFLCDWQYSDRINGSPGVDTTAENLAVLFMLLDNNVFGHNRFTITDSSLFANMPKPPGYTGREIAINIPPNSGGRYNRTELQTIMVCFYGYVCGTPSSIACTGENGCDYLNCPTGQCYATATCFDFEVEEGTGGGAGSGSGSGGSGSGGSGTGGGIPGGPWTPPPCPGTVAARGAAFYECQPGWNPHPGGGDSTIPKDPCDKVIPLKTDAEYINRSIELKNSTTLNYEKSYVQNKDGVFLYKEGPVNEGKVDLIIRDTVFNINHSHYDGKMFSEDDLWTAWSFQITNHLVDSAFTLAVSTNAGTSYVFTIDDPIKFQAFGAKYFVNEGDIEKLENKFNKGYKIGKSNSPSVNETSFLQFIRDENVGISLLKANDTFTSYQRLILNRDGLLTPIPCN